MSSRKTGHRPLLVALTGGVASGKTSVSNRLAEHGVPVVDTDLIAREVVAPESDGLQRVIDAFGHEVLDASGALDRAALRERVFSHASQRKRLEAILHPLIEKEARQQIALHGDADYVVLVVPLLVESGLFADADRIVVVDVPETVQIQRLRERDGVDAAQAEAMLAAQVERSDRLEAATDVIDNSGSLEALEKATDELHERLTLLSRRRARSTRTP